MRTRATTSAGPDDARSEPAANHQQQAAVVVSLGCTRCSLCEGRHGRRYGRRDMEFSLATVAIVFGTIFVVELPDKTFIATLVLATRFRPLLVWIGVARARSSSRPLVAVLVGGLLAQLPRTPGARSFAAVMFLVGGIILIRGAGKRRRGGGRDRGGVLAQGRGDGDRPQGDRHELRRAVPRRVGRPLAAADRVAWSSSTTSRVGLRRCVRARWPRSRGSAALLGRALLARIQPVDDPPHRRRGLPAPRRA